MESWARLVKRPVRHWPDLLNFDIISKLEAVFYQNYNLDKQEITRFI